MLRVSAAALGLLVLSACGDQRPPHYGGLTEIGLNITSNKTQCPMDDLRISNRREIGFSKMAWDAQCASTGTVHACQMAGGVTTCVVK